jgi:hypothetical protein
MSIAVEHERFILTAILIRNHILSATTDRSKPAYAVGASSGGNS